MTRIDEGLNVAGKTSPAGAFWRALGFVFAGWFIGQFVSYFLMLAFGIINGVDITALADSALLMDSLSKVQFYLSQAAYTLVFCFLTPWVFLKLNRQKGFAVINTAPKESFGQGRLPVQAFGLAILATLSFMCVNSWLVEWNAGIHLPESLSGLEEILRQMEDELAETIKKLTHFDNFGTFLLAFVVIAILPGIGEEFLFRGVLQNTLHRYTRNAHIAIWGTAFIFAAIHLQFYDIAPRTALGALFGYLYVWSGNLKLAMVAHITNNGMALIVAYYVQVRGLDFDLDDPSGIPIHIGLIALVATGVLLFIFRNQGAGKQKIRELGK